jgi:hypothetical protein
MPLDLHSLRDSPHIKSNYDYKSSWVFPLRGDGWWNRFLKAAEAELEPPCGGRGVGFLGYSRMAGITVPYW